MRAMLLTGYETIISVEQTEVTTRLKVLFMARKESIVGKFCMEATRSKV